jgi:hypothetical protein
MRPILLLKIALLVALIYFSFHLLYLDYTVDKSILAQSTALLKLRGDPHLDTAENRKRVLEKRATIEKEIEILTTQKHPYWYKTIALFLGIIAGWLIRNIIATQFKKRAKNNRM